jgi:3-oxoacyl-[acyl-carrier protein] reductase
LLVGKPLAGKVAIVTGSGRGIGRATATHLAHAGAHVVINDIDDGPAQEAAEEVRKSGGEAAVVLGSVVKPETAQALVEAAVKAWGRLDVLVNNAGITRDAMLQRMTDEQFTLVLDVIVRGSFNCIRAAAPYMRDAGKNDLKAGRRVHRKIVNVSSIAGIHGAVGNVNYATAKAAIVGMTKAVAREWAPFMINCNAVAPGIIDTRMTAARTDSKDVATLGIPADVREQIIKKIPIGRIGTPEDVANAILFFASPASDFITGEVLEIHGGLEFINVVS